MIIWTSLSCLWTLAGLCHACSLYSLQGLSMVLWLFPSCEDPSGQFTKQKLLCLVFIVSAPINCRAVGISVALGFSLAMCCNSQLCTEWNHFVDASPQMVSGKWLLWRMVWLQQRKAQSLSSSTLSSSKGRHIYWKTSSARYSLSMYLLHFLLWKVAYQEHVWGFETLHSQQIPWEPRLRTMMQAFVTPPECQADAWLGLLMPALRQNTPCCCLAMHWSRTMFFRAVELKPFLHREFIYRVTA